MAGTHDLTFTQGVPFTETYAWFTEAGERRPFTGYTARAEVRTGPGGPLLLDLTPFFHVVAGVEVQETSGEALRLSIPAATTSALSRNGFYDLFLIPTGPGTPRRFMAGAVHVVKAVTRV